MTGRYLLSLLAILSVFLVHSMGLSDEIASVKDDSCTLGVPCGGQDSQGCDSVDFSVPQSGWFVLTASLPECSGQATCSGCLAEAYVYTQTGSLVACVHSDCGTSCDPHSTGVYLQKALNYTLYACKIDCNSDDCDECPGDCSAKAAVSTP